MDATEINVPEGMQKKEWFKTKEFIKGVGTSNSAFNRWLKSHPEFVQQYCQNIGRGSKRPRYLILWKGIAAYVNEYAKTRPARKIVNNLSTISEAKKQSTDIVNKEIEKQNSQVPDLNKMLLMSQNLLLAIGGVNEKVNQLQTEMNGALKVIENVVVRMDAQEMEMKKPLPVTSIHRQFLNDRVRLFAIQENIEFSRVWRKVNEHVGRGGVAFYNFADFRKGLAFVKGLYEQSGMDWE